MFYEIMKGVNEFLSSTKEDAFADAVDTTAIAKYLNLGYDIPADSITTVKEIRVGKTIPLIVLVDIDYKIDYRIEDYIFYKGELTKVISFDKSLFEKGEGNIITMVLCLFGDIVNTTIDSYKSLLSGTTTAQISFVDILKYAPYIMSIAYLQEKYPFIETEKILPIFQYMYPMMTEKSINSAKALTSEFTIGALFDNCVWYGVTNNEFPDIKCFDLKKAEEHKHCECHCHEEGKECQCGGHCKDEHVEDDAIKTYVFGEDDDTSNEELEYAEVEYPFNESEETDEWVWEESDDNGEEAANTTNDIPKA